MECKPIYETVHLNEMVYEGSSEQAIDVDIVLPDYCPDIGKILKCCVEPRVLSKEYSSEKLTAEVCALIKVFYVDDVRKCVNSYEQEFPFTSEFNVKGAGDSVCAEICAKTDYVNCRAVSQRKLDIHGAVSVFANIFAQQAQDMICDVEGAGVNLKKQTLATSCIAGTAQQQFTISDTLELGSAKPPASSVLRSEAVVCATECKAIANKLILKGEAIVRMLYKNDLEEEKNESMEFMIPFNQFIDIPGVDDTCDIDAVMDVAAIKLTPRTDGDGEYKMINMDLRVNCTVKAYVSKDVCVISDAYSTEYEIETESKSIRLEKLIKTVTDNCMVKELADLSGNKLSGVTDVWCNITDSNTMIKDGNLTVKGTACFCMIAMDEKKDTVYIERNSGFEYSCSVCDANVNARSKASIAVVSVSYSFSGTDKMELRAELKMSAPIYGIYDIKSISSISPDETRIKQIAAMPALTVYYAEKGETLWNIARNHNSSVDVIMRENDIDEEVLSENRMLLISV